MSPKARFVLISIVVVGLATALQADTLILRNGGRVSGELVSVRNGVVEFEERRGFGGSGRTIRVSRDEVVSIELEGRGYNPGDGWGGGVGGGRPPGMRERVISVSAVQQWTDTGVSVRPGQTVFFEASGQVRWGPGRRDGPEGENDSPFNRARPIPNRPAAALIGSVGDGNDIFFIGADRGPIRVRGGGRLLLGINDEGLQDNSGNFRVTIYY